jgi:hypothetical protein
MKRKQFVLLVLTVARISLLPMQAQSTNTNIVASAPQILGLSYRCDNMIKCVNGLHQLGREQALATLREFSASLKSPQLMREERKLHLICRLLFVNEKGWKPPRIGAPWPEVDWTVAERFPLFPLAVVDGVPFLLVRDYQMVGASEPGADALKVCEKSEIITNGLPRLQVSGYRQAALRLTRSDLFRQLYKDTNDVSAMTEMIMQQAAVKAK